MASADQTGIADRTSIGFVWSFLQVVLSKISGIVGQVCLAYFLVPDDMGMVSLAVTVSAFAGLMQKFGLRDVLIHRQAKFHLWQNAAFWLSLVIGLISALFMILAAPVAAYFYEQPTLMGLIGVLAMFVLFDSASSVPAAKLQSQMQFRLIATVNTVVAFFGVLLSVLFAYLGFGPYSIVLPQPIMAMAKCAIFFVKTDVKIRRDLEIRRWRYLAGTAGILLLTYVVVTITSHGGYLIIGRLYGTHVVGMYYFAFNLSTQAFSLLAMNLAIVLFPALQRLHQQPERQIDAFHRAACSLVAIGLPICFLQAVAADSLIYLLFEPKWYPAIPLLQILSFGITFRIIVLPVTSLLKSQGRFWTLFVFFAINAFMYVVMVTVGARVAQNIGAAIAVAIYSVVLGFGALSIGMLPSGRSIHRAFQVFAAPLVAGIIAFVPARMAASLIPPIAAQHGLRIVVIIMVSFPLYFLSARLLMPATVAEVANQTKRIAAPFLRRFRAAESTA